VAVAPRMVAKLVKAPRVIARKQPVAAAPRVLAKVERAAEAPSMPAKAEPVEKTSRVFVNSDWLVTLETAPAKAAAPARAPVAGAGRTARLRQFEAYVMSKKSDPYSNLR